jgi:hypothetical protein
MKEGIAMNRATLSLPIAFCGALLCAAVSFAQIPAYTKAGPVPLALHTAKTIFVSNGGSDSGLFPSPFSGDTNRPYSEFYAALQASGKYSLVDDPSQASLVLNLRLTAPYGPSHDEKYHGTADPLPMFRLIIYDRKTHYVLWTITESIDSALLQKSHDHNFDTALNAVVRDFEQVTDKVPSTP